MNKTKFISTIAVFVVAVAASFVLIAKTAKAPSAYTDGVYTGTADGRNGPIEISITIKNGAIVDGEIISEEETGFAKPAISDVLDQAIANGNLNSYDAVSGCTISSDATAKAIRIALANARK